MMSTSGPQNRFRHVLKILLVVGVFGQIAVLVLCYLVAVLRGGTLWRTANGIPLPLFPVGPGMYFASVLVRPRGRHDSRFFFVGFLINSLIYTAVWLVSVWALRGFRTHGKTAVGVKQ
jgi:hypothetical protein